MQCIINKLIKYRGVEQLVARRAHNPEVAGSSPVPATKMKTASKGAVFRFGSVASLCLPLWVMRPTSVARWENTARAAGGGYSEQCFPQRSNFYAEAISGAENVLINTNTTVCGYVIFQSEIQKIQFPQNDLCGRLELNSILP